MSINKELALAEQSVVESYAAYEMTKPGKNGPTRSSRYGCAFPGHKQTRAVHIYAL